MFDQMIVTNKSARAMFTVVLSDQFVHFFVSLQVDFVVVRFDAFGALEWLVFAVFLEVLVQLIDARISFAALLAFVDAVSRVRDVNVLGEVTLLAEMLVTRFAVMSELLFWLSGDNFCLDLLWI